ncbi:MAG: hypothetical protein WAR79_06585 [Melioribacteraceae bacterium]
MNNAFLLIDSHVHIHDCFDTNEFFESVFENFENIAEEINKSEDWIGILLLSEISGINYFNKLINNDSIIDAKKFSIRKTEENNSLIIENNKSQILIIVAGKQIIARDGIEILALCSNSEFENGKDVEHTVREINKIGGIPVLPWGVGKWLGSRKKIIENYVRESKDFFFLGDNSARPSFWSEPQIFKLGKLKKHFVLPGTDALPITSEQNKTGSYGFSLEEEINLRYPASEVKRIFINLHEQPVFFGKHESTLRFFKNQILMQANKQKKK